MLGGVDFKVRGGVGVRDGRVRAEGGVGTATGEAERDNDSASAAKGDGGGITSAEGVLQSFCFFGGGCALGTRVWRMSS